MVGTRHPHFVPGRIVPGVRRVIADGPHAAGAGLRVVAGEVAGRPVGCLHGVLVVAYRAADHVAVGVRRAAAARTLGADTVEGLGSSRYSSHCVFSLLRSWG